MAISFVGSYQGTHASTSAQTVAFSNLKDGSNTTPTLQQGDMVLVSVNNASTVDRTASLVPTGYTAAHTGIYQNDSNDTSLQASYKFMGATPDTSVSIPASNATTAGVAYTIHVFRGVDPNNPLDVAAVTTGGNNTAAVNPAAITPATAGAWIYTAGGGAMAAGATYQTTAPTGFDSTTNAWRSVVLTTTTNDPGLASGYKSDWSSGAFDPPAFTGGTTTNTGSWAAVTLALRPLVNAPDVATLGDNFDDNSFDTAKWADDVGVAVTESTGGSVTETNGRAEIIPGTEGIFRGRGYKSVDLYNLIGNSIFVKVSSASSIPSNQIVYLSFGNSNSHVASIQVSNGQINLQDDTGGTIGFTYDPALHAWWRLRESGGQIFLDTAPDTASNPPVSGDWTQQAARTYSGTVILSAGNAAFGTAVGSTTSPAPTTIYFDGFNTAANAAGGAGIQGSLSVTLAALTTTAAAQLQLKGQVGATLAPLSATSASTLLIAGQAGPTLAPLTSTAAGKLPVVGTSNATLAPLTAVAMGGAPPISGQAAITLAPLTSTSGANLVIKGSASPTLAPLTSTSAAALPIVGQSVTTLLPLTSTSSANLVIKGSASPALAALTSTSAAALKITGQATSSLAPLTTAASSTLSITAALSTTLSPLTATAAAQLTIAGSAIATLSPLTSSSSAKLQIVGSGSPLLSPLTTTAAGVLPIVGALGATLQPLTLTANQDVQLIQGNVNATLSPLTSTSSAALAIAAQAANTLAPLVGSATAVLLARGALSSILSPLTSAASGKLPIAGQVGGALGLLTTTSTSALLIQGTFGGALQPLTLSADQGSAPNEGQLVTTLQPLSTFGSGALLLSGAAVLSLGPLTAVSTSSLEITGGLLQPLGLLQTEAAGRLLIGGDSVMTLAPLTLVAYGGVPFIGDTTNILDSHIGNDNQQISNSNNWGLSSNRKPNDLLSNGGNYGTVA